MKLDLVVELPDFPSATFCSYQRMLPIFFSTKVICGSLLKEYADACKMKKRIK